MGIYFIESVCGTDEMQYYYGKVIGNINKRRSKIFVKCLLYYVYVVLSFMTHEAITQSDRLVGLERRGK